MESIHASTLQDYTDKLMSQFNRATDTLEGLMAGGFTREEAVTTITAVVALTFVPFDASNGEAAQFLSDWHKSIASRCSDEYRQIRQDLPELSKQDVNQDPYLSRLNSIRRGVRFAMRKGYKDASNLGGQESWPSFTIGGVHGSEFDVS